MRSLYCCIFVLFLWRSVDADCGVVSKKEWGALPEREVEPLSRPVNLVIITESVTPWCNTTEDCIRHNLYIQNWMMTNLNYPDLGYSFMIGGDAKIYEGTGFHRVGRHTLEYSQKSIGVCFNGHYFKDHPSPQQVEAVKALLKCGVEKGHLTPDFRLVGLKQVVNSTLPRQLLYDEIKKWPQWVEKLDTKSN